MIINKIKILAWAVVLLLLLNVVTIATIVYQKGCSEDREFVVIEPGTEPLNGQYFRQQLGFNNDQMKVFRSANRIFRSEAKRIVSDIEVQKGLMLRELVAGRPDRARIEEISSRIGLLHKELKLVTANFYLALKEECNQEQQVKLQTIFQPLFGSSVTGSCGPKEGCRERVIIN